MSRPQRWWAGGLGAVLVAAVLVASGVGGSVDGERVRVERGDLVLSVPVDGALEAIDPVLLGPPSVGDVSNFQIAFMAPEGSEVAPGQPVLGFDTAELEERLLERAAARDSAEKELEKRRADIAKRRDELALQLAEARARQRKAELQLAVPADLVAASELERQRIDRRIAEAEIAALTERLTLLERQARAEIGSLQERRAAAASRVTEIERDIGRLKIAAPRAGVVIYTPDWRGEKRKVGDSTWRGRAVLEIPDLNRLLARGMVDEADAGTIAVGQRVRFRLDALPDEEVSGRVTAIGRTVQQRSETDPVKVVRLEITLDTIDPRRFRPGMRFRGEVETARIEDAVLVPAEAISLGPEGPRVYRETLLGVEEIRPQLGRRSEEAVEVLAGLAPGDRLVLVTTEEDAS